ncbi:hypothetical protein EG68_01493 [Paragonimus skrjabini miyazakii]|uniref:G-protein coupled receptors family 1 profile domain-containing protein n=1 Tax=Paragonimus skrjabini miyazakii TaxID=59628 RepID=A0A8S9ZBQ9_9TREM|nr:hypothetical protein EG68_01493 [Paragonimus skrjabini miyazakii]
MNSNVTDDCIPNLFQNTVAGIVVTHVSLCIAMIGIPVNLLTLIVLRRSTSRGATNLLLVVLATEDILIIISYSLYYVAIHYFENYDLTWLGLLRYADSPLLFVLSWVKMAEIYTIVLLSLQRFLAIRWPLHAASLCSIGRTKRVLGAIIILSAMFKLPNLILDYRTLVYKPSCKQYVLREVFKDKSWHLHFKLIHVQLLDQVIGYLIPLLALIVLNIGLIIRVRNATRQRMGENGLGFTHHGTHSAETAEENVKLTRPNRNMRVNIESRPKKSLTYPCASDHGLANSSSNIERCTSDTTHIDAVPMPQTSQQNVQSKSVTLILIGVVTTFIVFETPTTTCFCYQLWLSINELLGMRSNSVKPTTLEPENSSVDKESGAEDFIFYAYPSALLCVLIGCASNFVIYMLVGSKFRRMCIHVIRQYIRCGCWRGETNKRKISWNRKTPIRRGAAQRRPERQLTMTVTEKFLTETAPLDK